ncbi:MAG: IS4 family transposase [Bacteroidaceae bacterium]|nr:IS4 family transposase [Bacteroidaceae bacterium]
MNVGRYIFSQVVKYIPRYQFDKCVKKYHGDWHVKELTCYNQLLHLLFGQLTNCDSLRDICLCLDAHKENLYHLGFGNTVNQSSLSRANDNRDFRIYEEFGVYMIHQVRPLYTKSSVSDITMDNVLYALDSTTISTSIKLATWAYGKYSKGAVKMHTLLDLRGSIPANIHITNGKWHDSNELELLTPEPLAFYMMDRAYVDFDEFFRFHLAGAYWVSRPKSNMKYEIIGHRKDFAREDGIRGDFIIRLTKNKTNALYPEPFRAVCCYDEDAGEEIVFITNNFEISAMEVAILYRHRWDIEVFFKWIKQNIVVKTLWGYSENAVRIHLWVAVIAYLLVARIKADNKSPYTITEVATLIRVSAFERTYLRDLITKPRTSVNFNQNVKELTLFDDI